MSSPTQDCRLWLDGRSCASGEVVLLIGHGTRDPNGAEELRVFAAALAARLGDGRPVIPCFLELAPPSILEAIEAIVQQGVRRIVAVPLLLFSAGHVKNDIAAAINVARSRHPGLRIWYGAPLEVQPQMLAAVDDRLAELERALPPRPRAETAVLVVERGSSDPAANAAVYQLARLIWEGRDFGWVETCFIGITRPSLEEGLERCRLLGARRILVLPYFLFTGVLLRRIGRIVDRYGRCHPELELGVARHLGIHPSVVELALRRVEEAGAGEVRMSCDLCVYRVPLVGFEDRVGQPPRSDHAHGLREGDHAHHHHVGHNHHHPHEAPGHHRRARQAHPQLDYQPELDAWQVDGHGHA